MKLADYLEETGMTQAAFAAKIRVHQRTVTRYVAGGRMPRPTVMKRIEEETDGKVRPEDFY